jgi:uncharacterized LabA/DUF88 family protein
MPAFDSSTPPIEYLFVDGGSLRGYLTNLSARFYNGEVFDLDFTLIDSNFTKVFYYDAIPTRTLQEAEAPYLQRIAPQRELLDRLTSTDRVHVYEGDARKRKQRGGLEQKMVDVMLTVDMLTHSFRRNMQRATLYTGDQDFKPLVDALVQEGMFVTLWYPPGETNSELIAAADRRRPMRLGELANLLTPESRARLRLPPVTNFPPEIEPGDKRCGWSDGGRSYGIYRDGTDWVITRSGDALNRLHLRGPHWELLCVRAAEESIVLPPELENYGIENP